MDQGATRRLARGDIVTRGHTSGVVWVVESCRIVILPLIPSAGAMRRNDVPIRDWCDIVAIGRGGLDLAIRPAAARIEAAAAGTWSITGRLTDTLLAEVSAAVARELADQAICERYARSRSKPAR